MWLKLKTGLFSEKKAAYKLELLSPETIKVLGSAKKDVGQDEDGENVSKLESIEVVLVHCNLVNNNYQQASMVVFTFTFEKQFGQLIIIAPQSLTILKTTNAKFHYNEVWFTDQNNRPLEREDYVNILLIIAKG